MKGPPFRKLTPKLPLGAIFAVPLAICMLSGLGLVSALTGDGWRDLLSWIGLGAPVLAVVWAMKARRT
ncbi:MAG TPA: hypothetical protein VJM34_14110 [Novosphingobium sp.]|nr:hypothetical protein [Novosphingobium sp.]